jgi:hypothetical protein
VKLRKVWILEDPKDKGYGKGFYMVAGVWVLSGYCWLLFFTLTNFPCKDSFVSVIFVK